MYLPVQSRCELISTRLLLTANSPRQDRISGTPPDGSLQHQVAQIMLKATNEERGTVAALGALSQELEDVHEDGMGFHTFCAESNHYSLEGQHLSFSARNKVKRLSNKTYQQLSRTLNIRFPDHPVHCQSERPKSFHSIPLSPEATFFDYVVLGGRRYHASRAVGSNRSALVEVVLKNLHMNGQSSCGELLEIFKTDPYRNSQPQFLGHVRWYKEWDQPCEAIWTQDSKSNHHLSDYVLTPRLSVVP